MYRQNVFKNLPMKDCDYVSIRIGFSFFFFFSSIFWFSFSENEHCWKSKVKKRKKKEGETTDAPVNLSGPTLKYQTAFPLTNTNLCQHCLRCKKILTLILPILPTCCFPSFPTNTLIYIQRLHRIIPFPENLSFIRSLLS